MVLRLQRAVEGEVVRLRGATVVSGWFEKLPSWAGGSALPLPAALQWGRRLVCVCMFLRTQERLRIVR